MFKLSRRPLEESTQNVKVEGSDKDRVILDRYWTVTLSCPISN